MMRHLIFAIVFSSFLACSSTDEINSDTPEGLFKLGTEYKGDERYEEALVHFKELKNKHPYSKYATESEMSIADIHFIREAYVEAENAYKLFQEFHPKHPKADFVTFRIAMSIFKQLPESIDRDLSLANDAVMYFTQVFTTYPQSDYAGSAKDHRNKCLLKMARKEYYIANFYYIREMFDSALSRYEGILNRYKSLGMEPKTLFGASSSALKLKDRTKALKFYRRLINEFPKSKWSKKAKNELANKLEG